MIINGKCDRSHAKVGGHWRSTHKAGTHVRNKNNNLQGGGVT